jgi:enamine deaminase RidA (YjgF/YER057c/UK114 family)
MLKQIETDAAPKPFSNYSQAIEVAPGARYLLVAGQVGADRSGKIAEGAEEQHRLAWANVLGILRAWIIAISWMPMSSSPTARRSGCTGR